ncbi:isopenicillin N synthase family dioxygenase [Mycolicibacterium sp. CBM1]
MTYHDQPAIVPAAEYLTTTDLSDDPSTGVFEVQVIDIAPALSPTATTDDIRSVATELVQSFVETGFAVVTGHGVASSLFDAMCAMSSEFFALPLAEKLEVTFPAPEIIRGYEPAPDTAETARAFNAMESFLINRLDPLDDFNPDSNEWRLWRWPNLWPERPAAMRPVWESYYQAMDALGARLLELVAVGFGLPSNVFERFFDRHFNNLAFNYYPPRDAVEHSDVIPNGTHTDHGALTLLYRPSEPGGLEVFAQDHWWTVPWVPNSLVLNIGDVLEYWTGGRVAATPHRVVWSTGPGAEAGRQSIAFFQQPNPDAPLSPIIGTDAAEPAPATTAGVHVSRKELGQHTLDALGI